MANAAFQVIISTVDRSSPALAAIKRQLEGLSNEAMRVQVRTARLAAFPTARIRGALTGLSGAFTTLRGHLGGAWSGLTSLMPPLAALGAGTSLAGLFELVRHVAEARHEVTKMAETIGIAPPQMARLNFAARMTGTNVESMQVGLTKLNKVMGDTVRGKNKDAAALFRQIGISTQELASGNAATVLPKIAASFQATHSATMRAAMAQALFGRGWREMAPLLLAGPEEMRAWIAQLDRLGYKFTQVDDNNLTAFRRSWVGLETAVGGFTNMLGARLAPVLTPIIGQFSDWIAVNREWIANWITDHVKQAISWLREHKERIKETIRVTGEWIDKLGGLKGVLIATGLLMVGPFLVGILSFTAAVVRLAWAFSVTLVAAIRAAGEALIAFNARAMALPVFRILALGLNLADLYDKAKEGRPVTPQSTPPSSPDFKHLTPQQQEESWRLHPPGSEGSGSWLRDQLGDFWRWLRTPPAGTPAPGQGGGSGGGAPGSGGGMFFGPQLVPVPGARPGGIGPLQILSNLYSPAVEPAAPSVQGAVDVNVRFANAPPGMQVDTQSNGQVRAPRPEVGYAFGFERLGYA